MNYIAVIIARFMVRLIVSVMNAFMKAFKGDMAKSLCMHCVHAHVTIGRRPDQRMTTCTYGGVSRAMKFVVSDCSMFSSRNATSKVVCITGFAQPSEPANAVIVAKANP